MANTPFSGAYVPECIKVALYDLDPNRFSGSCRGCECSFDPDRYDGGCLLAHDSLFVERAIENGLKNHTPEELQKKLDETRALIAEWNRGKQ